MLSRLSLLLFSAWLGIGIGVAFVAIPVVFGFKNALPPGEAGRIAQSILLRLFEWQAGLAGAAALLYGWQRWRHPASAGNLRAWLLPPLLAGALIALHWLHPKLAALHAERYAPNTPELRRQEVASQFARWHGASQASNLLMLIGVLACWNSLTHPVRSCAGGGKGEAPVTT